MKVVKLLNNNVIIAKDRRHGEVVVMGTGIGFQAKVGDKIPAEKIQKVFVLKDHSRLAELIAQIPASYLELCEKLVLYAKNKHQIHLSESIYLSLTDHLYFALKRIKEGAEIDHPFLIEVKQFYPKEFEIGQYAKKLIMEMYSIEIPEEEMGYIAMHVIENTSHRDKRYVGDTLLVINMTIAFLQDHYLHQIKQESMAYTRLVTHVKHFAKRYVDQEENEVIDQLLSKTIMEHFQEECACVEALSQTLEQRFGRNIQNPEKNYLILHLRNCRDLK